MAEDAFSAYVQCFCAEDWLEANEVLEHHWQGHRNDFHKAFIQLAVAIHQDRTGRQGGAGKLLAKAEGHLNKYRPHHQGVDVEAVLSAVHAGQRSVEAGERVPGAVVAELKALLRQATGRRGE